MVSEIVCNGNALTSDALKEAEGLQQMLGGVRSFDEEAFFHDMPRLLRMASGLSCADRVTEVLSKLYGYVREHNLLDSVRSDGKWRIRPDQRFCRGLWPWDFKNHLQQVAPIYTYYRE